MDWTLILNIAVGMTCGFILMDALRIVAQIVFFILATLVFLLRLAIGALVDAWRKS
jgi:hypothetical protein